MASSFTTYFEEAILNHVFGKASYTAPTMYAGLSTALPGRDASGLAEPSGANGYARVSTSASNWNSAVDSGTAGLTDNHDAITFPEATGSWGTVYYGCLFDNLTTGHLLAYFLLDTPTAITTGNTPRFNAGDFNLTLT